MFVCDGEAYDPATGELSPELKDPTSFGRLRPWRQRKEQSLGVVEAYQELAGRRGLSRDLRDRFAQVAERMGVCGTSLEFLVGAHITTGCECKRLNRANFCGNRLCVMCNWRRSRKMAHQLGAVVTAYKAEHGGYAVLMLTLTERNMGPHQLAASIGELLEGFMRLRKRKRFQAAVLGWFRSLEVAWKATGCHPHFHILLMVPREYFDKRHDLYVSQAEWAEMWQSARRLDYRPVVDIRRVRNVRELTKYVVKPADFLSYEAASGWYADPDKIAALHVALEDRSLVAWSRSFNDVREKLGLLKRGDEDLVDAGVGDGLPEGYEPVRTEKHEWRSSGSKRGSYELSGFGTVEEYHAKKEAKAAAKARKLELDKLHRERDRRNMGARRHEQEGEASGVAGAAAEAQVRGGPAKSCEGGCEQGEFARSG